MTAPQAPGGQQQAGPGMPPGYGPNGQPQIPPDVAITLARQMGLAGAYWYPGTDEQLSPESERIARQGWEAEKRGRKRNAVMQREVSRELAAEGREPVRLVPAAEVWDEPDLTYLVRGMIPDTGIGALFGPKSTWKSFVALHLVLCVVYGLGFLGRPVDRPGWCFYLMGEGQRGARRRLRAATGDLPVPGGAPGRLAFVKIPFPLADEDTVTRLIADMRALAAGEPVSLTVFDAAADFYGTGTNENLAGDMEPVFAACKRIARELGCFVLLVAHSGHGDEPDHVRGTSRFGQVWDFEAQARRARDKPGCGWLTVSKSKEDEDGYSMPFHVALTDAGSLAIRDGHPDGDGGSGQQEEQAAPHPLEVLSVTEERILGDVVAYVRQHGGKAPLSFRRIKSGTKGKEATQRQMLDLAAACGLLDETEMRGQNHGYSYPGGFIRWLEEAVPEEAMRDVSPVSPLLLRNIREGYRDTRIPGVRDTPGIHRDTPALSCGNAGIHRDTQDRASRGVSPGVSRRETALMTG